MASTDLTFAIKAVNDATAALKSVSTDIERIGNVSEHSSGLLGRMGGALGDVAKIAGGFVVAQGLLKLPGMLLGAADAASDFEETLSKSNTVFKDSARQVEDWANSAAKNLGQSKQQALDAAGAFGNMFVQLGMGTDTAAKLSETAVKLASDFASFHNANPKDVLDAELSAYRGEYDALQKFVPTISAATIETEALAETGKKNANQLTAQEKATATFNYMLKNAGDALGDFGRTSDGAANKNRILAARLADMQVKIGELLLPLKVLALEGFLKVADAATTLFDGLKAGFTNAEGAHTVLYNLGQDLRDIWDAATNIAGVAWDGLIAVASAGWDAMRDAWSIIGPAVTTVAATAWDGLKSLGEVAWDKLKDAWSVVGPILVQVAGLAWDKLVELANVSWDKMSSAWDGISQKMGSIPWGKVRAEAGDSDNWAAAIDKVKNAVQPAIDVLKPLAEDALKAVRDQFKDVAAALGPFLEALKPLEPLLKPLGILIGVTIVAALAAVLVSFKLFTEFLTITLVTAIKTATLAIEGITAAFEFVTKAVKEWPPQLGHAFLSVIQTVEANAKMLLDPFIEGAKKMVGIGEDIINGIKKGIGDAWEGFTNWLGGLIDKLPGPFKKALEIFSPSERMAREVGVPIMQGVAKGIASGYEKYVEPLLSDVTSSIASLGGIKSLGGNFPEIIQDITGRSVQQGGALDWQALLAANIYTGAAAEVAGVKNPQQGVYYQVPPAGGAVQNIHVTLAVDGQVLAQVIANQQSRGY